MIVSADIGCPHYSPLVLGRVIVSLNGQVIKHCRFADDEAGRVIVFATDEQGRYKIDGMRILTEELRGDVEIQVMP